LVDRLEEGQGNPKEEVAIDSQRAYVIIWSSQLLLPLQSRFFFLRLLRPYPICWKKMANPRVG
jgi:hypothetical protein